MEVIRLYYRINNGGTIKKEREIEREKDHNIIHKKIHVIKISIQVGDV
jgi:hypothetical protein